jgi:RHS repeat-associated protein
VSTGYSYDSVSRSLTVLHQANDVILNLARYAYDANGNTLSDASGKSYTWDFENRLTQAVVPGTNGGTTIFKYDPLGRRIQKSGPLGTTNYLYDGFNVLQEADSSGNIIARYAQALGLDQPLSEFRSSTTSYYEADGLGSITSLTNSAGTTAETYGYDTFGNLLATTGTLINPIRYTSRELDSETGLNYFRARYYDATAGRFLSEDPIDFGGGINFYTYVANSPTNWVDPFGFAALSYGDIANMVAANNFSGQSDELIICLIYKESTFDPDAGLPGNQSATGLMGVTDGAATDLGVSWESVEQDPQINVATGTAYLGYRIGRSHGNVGAGLAGYGTGSSYADAILNCEKCLNQNANEPCDVKTKRCLEPLHPRRPPKPRHRRRRARP